MNNLKATFPTIVLSEEALDTLKTSPPRTLDRICRCVKERGGLGHNMLLPIAGYVARHDSNVRLKHPSSCPEASISMYLCTLGRLTTGRRPLSKHLHGSMSMEMAPLAAG